MADIIIVLILIAVSYTHLKWFLVSAKTKYLSESIFHRWRLVYEDVHVKFDVQLLSRWQILVLICKTTLI